jgi:hypothetical protein
LQSNISIMLAMIAWWMKSAMGKRKMSSCICMEVEADWDHELDFSG